jgi:hypothetical protein
MTDRSRSDPDVADHLASWLDREACIDALAEALKDAAAECEELLRDNRALRAALTDKCTEAAGLRMRLAHSLDRERLLQRHHRRTDWWSTVVVLWDKLLGRD